MTTQTEHAPVPSAGPQGTHLFVLAVDRPGVASASWHGTVTPPAGATRLDLLIFLKDELERQKPQLTDSSVISFSLEPNQI